MGRRRKRFFPSQDDVAVALIDLALADKDALSEVYRAAQRKAVLARRRNAKRREVERVKANAAAKRRRRVKPGVGLEQILDRPGWRVLVQRMAPGAWYGRPDLIRLMPEYAEGSVRAWLHQKLLAKGLVERTLNPDHDVSRPDRRQAEPRFLYRRTV